MRLLKKFKFENQADRNTFIWLIYASICVVINASNALIALGVICSTIWYAAAWLEEQRKKDG